MDFPGGSDGKVSLYSGRDPASIPGLGSSPGEGNGNPLQYIARKIPWTEEPSRLQSKSLQREESDVTEQLTHTHPKQKEAKWDKKYDYLEVMRR